jgi:hypothetical protein
MGIVYDRFNNLVAVEYEIATANNVKHPILLDLGKGECAKLENVDILNGSVKRRQGYTEVSLGNCHSGWSHPTKEEGYYVKDDTLFLFDGVSHISIVSVTGPRCCFCQVNDLVIYSDGTDIGAIKGGAVVSVPVPIEDYKIPLIGGQCLEFFNGVLYIGSGTTIYKSDPYSLFMDSRFCVESDFDSRVTMIKAVDAGLYVSTELETFFLTDELRVLADYGCILGTDITIKAENIKNGGEGTGVLWCSLRGVCFGDNTGNFTNITQENYNFDYGAVGGALLRFRDGHIHYLASTFKENTRFNPFIQPVLDVDSVD